MSKWSRWDKTKKRDADYKQFTVDNLTDANWLRVRIALAEHDRKVAVEQMPFSKNPDLREKGRRAIAKYGELIHQMREIYVSLLVAQELAVALGAAVGVMLKKKREGTP